MKKVCLLFSNMPSRGNDQNAGDSCHDDNNYRSKDINRCSFGSKNIRSPNIAMIVPRGFKLRDEFVCPITKELITDPVIASDGHTYDRAAIEQWFYGTGRNGSGTVRRSSPKTGQPLDHLHLTPNHNLKRLLGDMIREGGAALYCPDGVSCPQVQMRNVYNEGIGCPSESFENNLDPITEPMNIESKVVIDDHGVEVEQCGPRLALVRELVLTARCLGPPESDWNGRCFRLQESSASGGSGRIQGGRRRPYESTSSRGDIPTNFAQFTDATVSRRHFEICFFDDADNENTCSKKDFPNRTFAVRDLGSAGGTFVRVPPGKGLPLYPGTMIMLGKHQFLVSSCQDESEATSNAMNVYEENNSSSLSPSSGQGWNVVMGSVDAKTPKYGENNESYAFFSSSGVYSQKANLESNNSFGSSNSLQEELSQDNVAISRCSAVPCFLSEIAPERTVPIVTNAISPTSSVTQNAWQKTTLSLDTNVEQQEIQTIPTQVLENYEEQSRKSSALISLRCFAPEGTPIQGKEYFIGKEGATLGRKQGNSISFSHRVSNGLRLNNNSNRYSFVGIDSSISGEHATIKYNENAKTLELFDGVNDKGSTNGTWIRLSPMYRESDWFPLENKIEILIGTVRFQIMIDEVVVERDIYD